ncbi:hypothetical protein [Actinopolyspora halophila]|uniref:hypothetical protein n=1 Tax=Actinopolyspora halophila TaxID=1850 RepID=UPI000365A66F|nr:hypothetical protein [Actinopolyspora halophila]
MTPVVRARCKTSRRRPERLFHHDTDLRYKWWLWWSLADSCPGPGDQNQKRYERKDRRVALQRRGLDHVGRNHGGNHGFRW